jgi:hypothetical protein
VQAAEERWETCEIVEETLKSPGRFSKEERRLVAKAIGLKGVYVVGTSPIYIGDALMLDPSGSGVHSFKFLVEPSKRLVAMLNALIESLTVDGWEPVETHGRVWYSYKFRRRVK